MCERSEAEGVCAREGGCDGRRFRPLPRPLFVMALGLRESFRGELARTGGDAREQDGARGRRGRIGGCGRERFDGVFVDCSFRVVSRVVEVRTGASSCL